MELAGQLAFFSCQNSKEHVDHIVPGTPKSHTSSQRPTDLSGTQWTSLWTQLASSCRWLSPPTPPAARCCLAASTFSTNWAYFRVFVESFSFPPDQRCYRWAVPIVKPFQRGSPSKDFKMQSCVFQATSKSPWCPESARPCGLLLLGSPTEGWQAKQVPVTKMIKHYLEPWWGGTKLRLSRIKSTDILLWPKITTLLLFR